MSFNHEMQKALAKKTEWQIIGHCLEILKPGCFTFLITISCNEDLS